MDGFTDEAIQTSTDLSAQAARHRQKRGADMVTVPPLRLVHTWRSQQEAKRTDVLAERILAVMRRRQADARPNSSSRLSY